MGANSTRYNVCTLGGGFTLAHNRYLRLVEDAVSTQRTTARTCYSILKTLGTITARRLSHRHMRYISIHDERIKIETTISNFQFRWSDYLCTEEARIYMYIRIHITPHSIHNLTHARWMDTAVYSSRIVDSSPEHDADSCVTLSLP
jgi:hypothetical protein